MAAAGTHAQHPLASVISVLAALALAAWAAPAGGRPWVQALMTGGAVLAGLFALGWSPARAFSWLAVATGLAAWAGGLAAWAASPAEPLGAVDGLAAVGLLAVASVTLTLAASLVPGRPPVANLPVLVAIYLATPPFEALVAGFALRRTGNWRAFLGQRYRFGPNWPNLVGLGVASGVAIEVASALLLALQLRWLGIRPVSNNPFAIPGTSVLHSPWAVAAVAVAVAAMAPLAEELLFRGVLFGGLRRRWPYPLASATSAAIFAAAHLDPTLLPALLAAGLWLNALYQRTGSLIPSTVAHATFNGLAVALAVGMHVG